MTEPSFEKEASPRKPFVIETKEDKVLIQAIDRDHAFARYFMDVKLQKIPLEKIGNTIMLSDGKDEFAFRTVPLLWRIGVINEDVAVASLQQIFSEFSRNKVRKMLRELGNKDAERIVPLMDEFAEKEGLN